MCWGKCDATKQINHRCWSLHHHISVEVHVKLCHTCAVASMQKKSFGQVLPYIHCIYTVYIYTVTLVTCIQTPHNKSLQHPNNTPFGRTGSCMRLDSAVIGNKLSITALLGFNVSLL